MSQAAYHPLSEKEASSAPLPLYREDVESQRRPACAWRRLLTYALYAFALVQVSYVGTRYYLDAAHGHGAAHGKSHRLGTPCHGAHLHRNHSSVPGLQTHYTLPSGDRIPSAALGESQHYS